MGGGGQAFLCDAIGSRQPTACFPGKAEGKKILLLCWILGIPAAFAGFPSPGTGGSALFRQEFEDILKLRRIAYPGRKSASVFRNAHPKGAAWLCKLPETQFQIPEFLFARRSKDSFRGHIVFRILFCVCSQIQRDCT